MQRKIISKFVHFVKWPVQNALAFTTTRQNPFKNFLDCSSAPFDSFNLGLHVGDETKVVLHNRQSLLELLPVKTKIQWFEQVHGSSVLLIDEHSEQALVTDAAITREKNIALAIMTADCLPILLAAKDGSEIAAIHGGWKPLAKNIIANTVNLMNTPNEDIIAWLGPCIGKLSFEVGEEVKLAFENQLENFSAAFSIIASQTSLNSSNQTNKYLADLTMIAKIQLYALNIKMINDLHECTYRDEQQYFSYRRDKKTGRMASIICRI
jgi:YfiH family protein